MRFAVATRHCRRPSTAHIICVAVSAASNPGERPGRPTPTSPGKSAPPNSP